VSKIGYCNGQRKSDEKMNMIVHSSNLNNLALHFGCAGGNARIHLIAGILGQKRQPIPARPHHVNVDLFERRWHGTLQLPVDNG